MTVRNKTIQTIQDSFCDNINLKHGFNDQICLLYVSENCVHFVVQILFKYVKRLMRYVTTFFSTDSLEVKSIRKSLYFYINVFFFITLHAYM